MSKSPLIKSVIPKNNLILEVEFNNGVTKIYDCNKPLEEFEWYSDLKNNGLFYKAHADGGGYAIAWNENIDVCEWEIWDNGIEVESL